MACDCFIAKTMSARRTIDCECEALSAAFRNLQERIKNTAATVQER